MEDRRCKLGLQGRLELVLLIEQGLTRRRPRTGGGIAGRRPARLKRASRSCLATRSSRPRPCPWALPDAVGVSDRPSSLDDLEGAASPRRLTPPAARAPAPDDAALRVDPSRSAAAHRRLRAAQVRPARALGARQPLKALAQRRQGQGHRRIDDHTRLAYCELHASEDAPAVSATLRRATAWMLEQAKPRVLTAATDPAVLMAPHLRHDATAREANDLLPRTPNESPSLLPLRSAHQG
jgi:hypothetical protein